jgi:hypothetical protein
MSLQPLFGRRTGSETACNACERHKRAFSTRAGVAEHFCDHHIGKQRLQRLADMVFRRAQQVWERSKGLKATAAPRRRDRSEGHRSKLLDWSTSYAVQAPKETEQGCRLRTTPRWH